MGIGASIPHPHKPAMAKGAYKDFLQHRKGHKKTNVTFIKRIVFSGAMGRIKTKQIKAKTLEFLSKHGDSFSKDFNENKKTLGTLAEFRSKKIRNAVAGYLVRKKKEQ